MAEEAPLHAELADAPPGGRAFWIGDGIRAAVWPGAGRGTVLLFSGRTEYIEKYGRVIGDLTDRGFSVATLDWRGQGLSRRALDEPLKGHVGRFREYQDDVAAFLAAPEVAALDGPRVLIAHSMGGCIGMRALVDGRIEPAVAVFSAPMLGINLSGATRAGAKAMVALSRAFRFGTGFAPAPKGTQPYLSWQPFEGNALTNDREQYDRMRAQLEKVPAFGLAAPTFSWMGAAFRENEALEAAPPPDAPMLVFLGEEETVVDPDAIRRFAARAPLAQLVELPRAKHEVFMETPETQAAAWAAIDALLAERGV